MRLRSIVLGLVAVGCGAPQTPTGGDDDADVGPPGVVEIADIFCTTIGTDSVSASVSVDVALEVGEVFDVVVTLAMPPQTSEANTSLSCFPWDDIIVDGEVTGCQRNTPDQTANQRVTISYSETAMFGDLPTPVGLSVSADVRSAPGGAVVASDTMGVPCN